MNAGPCNRDKEVMDSSGADRIYFTTDALPERDRFPAFCEEVARCYIGLDLTTEDQSQFRASVELRRVGTIGIGRNATSRVASARTSNLSTMVTTAFSSRSWSTVTLIRRSATKHKDFGQEMASSPIAGIRVSLTSLLTPDFGI